ncbi:hypothetical protein [Methanosarcina horonobensis]|uniref:hypothetical protein n=1 Tax=Methanosarcina horonobensis TaxID=418008 RepID=UPI00064E86A3|nr:hypothetical protein [Methanosarcina horonobensis]
MKIISSRLIPVPHKGRNEMLQKMSTQFLATVSLAMLILVMILYYIEEFFFPGHDSSFMIFSRFVGLAIFALMATAVIAIAISVFKFAFKFVKRQIK